MIEVRRFDVCASDGTRYELVEFEERIITSIGDFPPQFGTRSHFALSDGTPASRNTMYDGDAATYSIQLEHGEIILRPC